MSQAGGGKMNENGEPANKRMRSESDLTDLNGSEAEQTAAIEKLLEEASTVQDEVEVLIDEENKEVAKVQDQFAKKRLDVYEKRSKILQAIPHFWTDVVLRSPVAEFLNDDDISIMEYLLEVKFFESSNPKITLIFDKNPYFSNKEIVKSFRVVEDGLESQEYNIEWAPGQNIAEKSKSRVGGKGFGKQRRERGGKESFFLWFSNEAAFDENAMVDAIRELYQYPFTYFSQEDEEQGNFEEVDNTNNGGARVSGKLRGDRIASQGDEEDEDEEEEGDEDDEDQYEEEEDDNNGRSVSPMLRVSNGTDGFDTDDDDTNNAGDLDEDDK